MVSVARNQPGALDELYSRYSRLVFSLALNMVSDRATAEEITLDVFTRVWEKATTYQVEQAKVSTWLVSITRHRAIDWLRRQSVRLDQSSLSWAEITPEATPQANGNLEQTVEISLRQAQVRAAVAQLPPEQREVLALAYFKGFTHSQIAEKLDQPLGTVKTRVRLAMQKLRVLLETENDL
jgi:RNA polymerase sigma-70 factor, ECF subfamily